MGPEPNGLGLSLTLIAPRVAGVTRRPRIAS
jgi:hypothetical protein